MKPQLLIALLALMLWPLAGADQAEVVASVSATRIGLEDTLTLTLTFHGLQDVAAPELARLYDFRILQRSQKSQFQFDNGVSSSSTSYLYILAPKKTGSLIIPIFSLQIAGKEYRTHPFQIEVVPGSVNPLPAAPQSQRSPFDFDDPLASFRQDHTPKKVDIRLKTLLSKKNVLIGEQVILHIILYTANQVEAPQMLSKQTPGFWQEWFPVPQQITGRRETENGVTYEIFEIRKAALFPTQAGQLNIPALNFQFEVADSGSMFFGTKPVTRATPETAITVTPLPASQANLPVGTFTFSVSTDKTQVDINDLATLKIVISGTGNTKALTPPLPASNDQFNVYPPKIAHDSNFDHEYMSGQVTVEVPLSFQKTGLAVIPALSFAYVNPESRKTVTLGSQPITISVSGQKIAEEQANTIEQSAIIQKGEDIQYIAGGRVSDQLHPVSGKTWFFWLLLLPFAANIVLFLKISLWDRHIAGSPLLRKRKLLALTLQALSRISQYEEIASVLETYLAQRTGIGLSDLSSQRLKEVCLATGMPLPAVDKLLIIKTNSEYSRYSPQKKTYRELKQDIEELKRLLRELDRRLG